jgi:hypothetical protein
MESTRDAVCASEEGLPIRSNQHNWTSVVVGRHLGRVPQVILAVAASTAATCTFYSYIIFIHDVSFIFLFESFFRYEGSNS